MSTHLGDLLDTARRQRLVVRHRELASSDDAVSGRSPRRVVFLHGPGGIGKTTLPHEFRARARAAGRTVVHLDGRDVDPSPDGLDIALHLAVGRANAGSSSARTRSTCSARSARPKSCSAKASKGRSRRPPPR